MSYRLERLGTPFFLSDTTHRTEALSQIQEAMSAGTPVTLAPAHTAHMGGSMPGEAAREAEANAPFQNPAYKAGVSLGKTWHTVPIPSLSIGSEILPKGREKSTRTENYEVLPRGTDFIWKTVRKFKLQGALENNAYFGGK